MFLNEIKQVPIIFFLHQLPLEMLTEWFDFNCEFQEPMQRYNKAFTFFTIMKQYTLTRPR